MADGKMKVTRIFNPEEKKQDGHKLLRVAAYCRVSTKSEEQASSYETQVTVFRQKIAEEPDWVLAGIYADRGISGTQAERRPEFLRMVKDCEDGKIDVVISKSVSRFSRNTVDAVHYIQKLTDMGIRLIFEKENIDTDAEYSSMLLTVLAAFAQEESHSHSENVKWGKRKKAMGGKPPLYPPYGFRKSEDGETMVIVPEEAEIVKWIFTAYEHGMPISSITAELLSKGTPPPMITEDRAGRWEDSRIWQMLNNIKYMGDIITQKRYNADFKTRKEVKNKGELPQKHYKGHHEPIVSEKQFNRCKFIMEMKSTSKARPAQYPYAEIIKCPYCGHTLRYGCQQQFKYPSLFCMGDGACREFVMERRLVDNVLMRAYAELDMEEIKALADSGSMEAKTLWETKQTEPVFSTVEYWWLDEFIEEIQFGQHTYTPGELRLMGKKRREKADDSTIQITWRCGLTQVLSTGITRLAQHPRSRAKRWNEYMLEHEDRYPDHAEAIRRMRKE